jgi:hypothetical protein
MSNIKRPQVISGYLHPDNCTYSKKGVYKTFTSDTGEKFKNVNEFGNIETGKQYTNTEVSDNEEICQICNLKSISVCPCAYNDKTCKNGHTWYTDRCGKLCVGNPH